jgi:hypothetical protein
LALREDEGGLLRLGILKNTTTLLVNVTSGRSLEEIIMRSPFFPVLDESSNGSELKLRCLIVFVLLSSLAGLDGSEALDDLGVVLWLRSEESLGYVHVLLPGRTAAVDRRLAIALMVLYTDIPGAPRVGVVWSSTWVVLR